MKTAEEILESTLDNEHSITSIIEAMKEYANQEARNTAISFTEWVIKNGYIYAGEHDYMYPDAYGLISGNDLFSEYLKEIEKL